MEQSHVYENTEVVKTGRTASKQLRSGKAEILYEITPKSTMTGSWKKWVPDSALYIVDGDEE